MRQQHKIIDNLPWDGHQLANGGLLGSHLGRASARSWPTRRPHYSADLDFSG
jgi:hypothetical protein